MWGVKQWPTVVALGTENWTMPPPGAKTGLAWASGKAVRYPADFKSLWLLGIQARGFPALDEVLRGSPFSLPENPGQKFQPEVMRPNASA